MLTYTANCLMNFGSKSPEGSLKDNICRVGYVSHAKHILFFLVVWEKVLCDQGFRVPYAGVGAADALYTRAGALTVPFSR